LLPAVVTGKAFTVTVEVAIQPVGKVYVIIDVPEDTPVTTPVPATTVATAGVALLQVPPAVASLSVVVDPAQTLVVPVIAAGNGFTTTVVAAGLTHPLLLVTVRL
jgi:hypothetical protein